MIKEVIFDIDDTLYDYEKGHAAGVRQMQEYAEQELGVSGEEFEREYRRQHADIKKRLGTDDATIHSRSIRSLLFSFCAYDTEQNLRIQI